MNEMDDIDYEFSPDEPVKPIIQVSKKRNTSFNIDNNIDKLVKSIDQFNKLPDSKKLGSLENIISQKKECEHMLEQMRKQVDTPALTPITITDGTVEQYIKRVKEIETIDVSKLPLKDKYEIYIEIISIKEGLNKLFATKRLEIKELKN